MIPYSKQKIDKKDVASVVITLNSSFLTQGPKVQEFEKKLAKYCGSKYAIAVCNGTAALHLAYLAAGIKRGDEVIITPNTFAATSNMLLVAGAKPVFCDIRLDTYNIDEAKIKDLITEKTKAIVPVHFAGQPCEMEKILKIAKKYGLIVIEDGCHALGTKYKNKKIGSIGDMTIFSFHPVKSITTGEGGAVLTDNKNYYEKLLLLRSHGITKDKNNFNVMTELGYNYRLTDIQAALGISQLDKLETFIKRRNDIAKYYNKILSSVSQIKLPTTLTHVKSSWHLYVIRIKNPKHRLPFMKYLTNAGIGVNFHYPAIYLHSYYKKLGYGTVNCPFMNEYHNSAITIPLYPSMTTKEVNFVCLKVKEFYNANHQ